jgi:hypothetical protein
LPLRFPLEAPACEMSAGPRKTGCLVDKELRTLEIGRGLLQKVCWWNLCVPRERSTAS